MHKKVNVSIKKRKNRKYLQARYRTSSGEWIEKSTKTTNRKEATAIGYEWAKAEMKESGRMVKRFLQSIGTVKANLLRYGQKLLNNPAP